MNDFDQKEESTPKQRRAKADVYRNESDNTFMVCGVAVASGETVEVTDQMKKNETAMKRVARAVETGKLSKV